MYRSGSLGGLCGMAAASRRCRSSSCRACCFLLPFNSPDFVLRSKMPKLERRGCNFPDSGIAARLGGEVPAEGVRGLLDETILDWIRMRRRLSGCISLSCDVRVAPQ